MSLLTEIRELEGKHLVVGLLGFLAIIGPGFLIIYHYHPELVEKYDVVKLTIFSGALSLPVLFANLMIVSATHSGPHFSQREGLILAALGSGLMLNSGIAAAFVLKLSFLSMAKLIAALSILFCGFAYFAQKDDKNKPNKARELTPPSVTPPANAGVTPDVGS